LEITHAFVAAFSLEKTVTLSPYPGKKTSTYLSWKELQRRSLSASFGRSKLVGVSRLWMKSRVALATFGREK